MLKPIVTWLHLVWPKMKIVFRGDLGFRAGKPCTCATARMLAIWWAWPKPHRPCLSVRYPGPPRHFNNSIVACRPADQHHLFRSGLVHTSRHDSGRIVRSAPGCLLGGNTTVGRLTQRRVYKNILIFCFAGTSVALVDTQQYAIRHLRRANSGATVTQFRSERAASVLEEGSRQYFNNQEDHDEQEEVCLGGCTCML